MIKDVTLTIPSHHDILDGFADIVRLGLRYCWGLKRFTIVLPGHFPEGGVVGNEGVYANAFRILRWLPRGCGVVLEGGGNEGIVRVVEDEGRLRGGLDEVCFAFSFWGLWLIECRRRILDANIRCLRSGGLGVGEVVLGLCSVFIEWLGC